MALSPLENEVLDLRDRVYELQCEIDALRASVRPEGGVFPTEWDLTRMENDVIAVLLAARGLFVSREALLTRLSRHDINTKSNLPNVMLCRIRAKIKSLSLPVEIINRYGFGFALTRGSIEFLDGALAEQKATADAAAKLAA